jgi:hypothetical protein
VPSHFNWTLPKQVLALKEKISTTESQKEMKAENTRQTVLQLLVLAEVYEVSTNLGTTSKF